MILCLLLDTIKFQSNIFGSSEVTPPPLWSTPLCSITACCICWLLNSPYSDVSKCLLIWTHRHCCCQRNVASVIVIVAPPSTVSPPCIPSPPATFVDCWMPYSTMYQSICQFGHLNVALTPSSLPIYPHTVNILHTPKSHNKLLSVMALSNCAPEGPRLNQAHASSPMVWSWRLCT